MKVFLAIVFFFVYVNGLAVCDECDIRYLLCRIDEHSICDCMKEADLCHQLTMIDETRNCSSIRVYGKFGDNHDCDKDYPLQYTDNIAMSFAFAMTLVFAVILVILGTRYIIWS